MSAAKRAVLGALGLQPEYTELLTTDDKAARLHAVPLWRVSLKHMARVLKHYKGRFNTIVGFQPTGWCMQTGAAPSAHRACNSFRSTSLHCVHSLSYFSPKRFTLSLPPAIRAACCILRCCLHAEGRSGCMLGILHRKRISCTDRGRAPRGRRRQKGTVIIYSVPYSEHSSHVELRAFVDFMRPVRVVPSVGNSSAEAAASIVASLRPSAAA